MRECSLTITVDGAPLTGSLTLDEVAAPRTVSIGVNSQPLSDVVVHVSSLAGGVVAIELSDGGHPTMITLDGTIGAANWTTGVTFPIYAFNDTIRSIDRSFDFDITTTSSDPCFNNLLTSLSGTVRDNDRYIFAADVMFRPVMSGGIPAADVRCSEYAAQHANDFAGPPMREVRAVLVDGTTRAARSDAGPINWVLQPLVSYRPTDDAPSTTNAEAVFDFSAAPLRAGFGQGGPQYWTGLNADWTTSTATCSGWTTLQGGDTGMTGRGSFMDERAITESVAQCDQALMLLCAEQ